MELTDLCACFSLVSDSSVCGFTVLLAGVTLKWQKRTPPHKWTLCQTDCSWYSEQLPGEKPCQASRCRSEEEVMFTQPELGWTNICGFEFKLKAGRIKVQLESVLLNVCVTCGNTCVVMSICMSVYRS